MKRHTLLVIYVLIPYILFSQNNYDPILAKTWPKHKSSINIGTPTGLGIDSKNNLVIFHRSGQNWTCLLYTSPSPRDGLLSRMPSSA